MCSLGVCLLRLAIELAWKAKQRIEHPELKLDFLFAVPMRRRLQCEAPVPVGA